MNKSFIKKPARFGELLDKHRLETGFSMLEAVVVVGVLLALAIGGFFAYGPITENAKIAKVKSSAAEVHTGVLVASMDGDASTDPEDVITDWNGSTDKIRVAIVSPAPGESSANGDFCVSATNLESPHITAQTGACDDAVSSPGQDTDNDGTPDSSDPDIDGDGTPNESDTTPGGATPGDNDGDGIPNASDTTPDGDTGGSEPGNNDAVLAATTWSGRTITNIYQDPGFKNGISGWTGNNIQSAYTDNAATSVSYVGSGYNGDSGALQISATGSTGRDRATAYFPINATTIKNFSFQITTPDGTWDPSASWYPSLMFTDSSGTVIGSGSNTQATRAGGLGANVWERVDYTNNTSAPTQPAQAWLVIQADHVPAGRTITMLVDRVFATGPECGWDCSAPESPSVPGYERNFDGSYTSSADWAYSWTGAVNASPSKAVATKAIAAPTTAFAGDTIQIKGAGYPANSTVTPSIFFDGAPGWSDKDFNAAPVQTDGSGNFDTTVQIPAGTQPWKWNVGVIEDTSWRAIAKIEIEAAPGAYSTPPGPWSELVNGSTEQISAPSVITVGEDFVVMGRGYEPYTRINVWSENYDTDGIDVYPYTDKNGNFTVTIPSGGAASGPGVLMTWYNENIRLNVTFQ